MAVAVSGSRLEGASRLRIPAVAPEPSLDI